MQTPAMDADLANDARPAVAVSVREASFADYDRIAALMQRYGMEAYSRDDWEHLWIGNPVYERSGRNWPIGWALESQDGRLVGFSGNVPVACWFQGKELTAAVTSAWVVDSEYRSHSMLLASKYFAQKDVDLLLNTTAVHVAGQIFRAFHAKPVPVVDLETTLFWVLDKRKFAASVLTRKDVPLASLLSYPAALALAAKAARKNGGPRNGSLPSVRSLQNFGGRFDAFWAELRRTSPALLSARDSESLRWHFRRSLKSNGLWIYAHEVEGRLTAYAIFQRQDKSDVGLTRVRLVDFQSLDTKPLILEAMIAAALDRAKREGVQMIEVVGFSGEVRSRLEMLAPFRRKLSSQLFHYKAMTKELKAQLANPAAWQPSSYDGDSSL